MVSTICQVQGSEKRHLVKYQVEGAGEFAWDMLRRDRSFFASEFDSSRCVLHGRRRVTLLAWANTARWEPLAERWRSFGWRVVEVGDWRETSQPEQG
jgi:hypothetical protein